MADLFDDEAPAPVPQEDGAVAMTEDEIGAMLSSEIDDAISYYDEVLGPARAEATRRYQGQPYGNEEEGRSAIVVRTMRDTIMQVMPSLLRIFTGPRRVVEFEPQRPDAEDIAKQRTEYVNHVFMRDNPGFQLMHDAFKDALTRRYAVWKWFWDDSTTVEYETYEGLTQEQVTDLSDDDTIEDLSYEQTGTVPLPADDSLTPDPMLPDQPPPPPQEAPVFTVRIRRLRPRKRAVVDVLPGEEFLIDRNATCIADAKIVGHRRGMTRSQLVAMGYDKAFLEEHEGNGAFAFDYAEERLARDPKNTFVSPDANPDDDLAETLYVEVWREIDRDGDGIAELYKVCLLGNGGFVARIEPAAEKPFALMQLDPEPHTLVGQGYEDILGDLAKVNTDVLRMTLDSFALTVQPRLTVVEQNVNMLDVLNTELNGVIRTKAPQSVEVMQTPFVGQHGLSMLEYLRSIVEETGGMNRASQGLDADSLQSTTKAAVAAQVTAAQQRQELIARMFAETGLRPVMDGLQRLLMRHQDAERMLRLGGKWVAVDPRTWNAALDVRVNVGLGAGPPEDRIQRLFAIAEKQELILQTYGITPLVTPDRYRNTLARIVEANGDDADSYFGEIPPGWTPPPPPTPPDPAMLLAEAQAKEIEARLQIEQAKLQQSQQEMLMKMELEREKLAQEQILKIKELELKHAVDLREQDIKREIEEAKIKAAPAPGAAT